MEDVQIILSALWIALMLTYLLGDVLRIFSGDFVVGEMAGQKATQGMWMAAAALMLIPIVMVFLSVAFTNPLNGWLNIIFAVFLFLFNLAGLRTYPSHYDRFLIAVSLLFNILTVWYAWNWLLVPA
ncbi:MAG: hypothetical protein EAX95_13915 [Candidatus Thorarchaeota archaeon]|nr:hypothetical protein [Candidatus Thorarchaeota archaeon]